MFHSPRFLKPKGGGSASPAAFNWVVADAAARNALTVTAADVYKVLYQIDTGQAYVLTDDSPVTWVPVGGAFNPNTFGAKASTTQALGAGGFVKINFGSEVFDTGGLYDPSTSRFAATATEIWDFSATISAAGGGQFNATSDIYLRKNGTDVLIANTANATLYSMQVHGRIPLVAGDYVEAWVFSANACTIGTNAAQNYFQGNKVYSPGGVEPASGTVFTAHKTVDQTGIANATWTKLTLGSENDPDAIFDLPNSKFTPSAGYWQFSWQGLIEADGGMTNGAVALYKNGSLFNHGNYWKPEVNFARAGDSRLIRCTGTDYFELYAFINGGGNRKVYAGEGETYMTAFKVRGL